MDMANILITSVSKGVYTMSAILVKMKGVLLDRFFNNNPIALQIWGFVQH
jgi:hypothetical protein